MIRFFFPMLEWITVQASGVMIGRVPGNRGFCFVIIPGKNDEYLVTSDIEELIPVKVHGLDKAKEVAHEIFRQYTMLKLVEYFVN
jgi:hypothetical protein